MGSTRGSPSCRNTQAWCTRPAAAASSRSQTDRRASAPEERSIDTRRCASVILTSCILSHDGALKHAPWDWPEAASLQQVVLPEHAGAQLLDGCQVEVLTYSQTLAARTVPLRAVSGSESRLIIASPRRSCCWNAKLIANRWHRARISIDDFANEPRRRARPSGTTYSFRVGDLGKS